MRDISVSKETGEIIGRVDGDDFSCSLYGSDFYYDGSPIQFEQFEMSGYKIDANGQFYTWRTKRPIVFTISLIPGSDSDRRLGLVVYACTCSSKWAAKVKSMKLTYNLTDIEFTNGVMGAALPGISATGDNRMGPRTYRFAFDRIGSLNLEKGRAFWA